MQEAALQQTKAAKAPPSIHSTSLNLKDAVTLLQVPVPVYSKRKLLPQNRSILLLRNRNIFLRVKSEVLSYYLAIYT
jgi:hypothetical protein